MEHQEFLEDESGFIIDLFQPESGGENAFLMKPYIKKLPALILALLMISGCAQLPAAAVVSTATPSTTSFQPLETATPSPSSVPPSETATPTATPTAALLPLTQYQLDVQLDFSNDRVDVQERIAITNRWNEPLPNLILVVEPNHYANVFTLNSIAINDGEPLSDTAYTLEGHRLTLPLESPLTAGQMLNLTLAYHLDLPAIPAPDPSLKPDPFGYNERQTNLVNWYPYLAAYDPGSGWLLHDSTYFGEHEVYDAADYAVTLELVNPPPGLVIAASAQAEEQDGIQHYSLSKARTFALSASTSYEVESQVVGSTTVTAYCFPWDKAASDAALKETGKALQLYSDLFGSYDRPSLTIVEAGFLDGMEYDGLFFLSYGFYNLYDGTPSGYLTAIAVHETAHQWWYAKVGSDQALEPWLDEAMATYTERIFYEHFYPQEINWWQEGRIDVFEPQGFINRPVSDYRTYESYRNSVYLNGALFFGDLRAQMGDDAFFAFLKDYASRFAYQRVTARDFFAVLRDHTEMDLTPLLDRYFDPAYLPSN